MTGSMNLVHHNINNSVYNRKSSHTRFLFPDYTLAGGEKNQSRSDFVIMYRQAEADGFS